jgi:hypothetical protein
MCDGGDGALRVIATVPTVEVTREMPPVAPSEVEKERIALAHDKDSGIAGCVRANRLAHPSGDFGVIAVLRDPVCVHVALDHSV